MFSVNSTVLFLIAACVILFVLAQSVFFLVRAYKQGRALGLSKSQLRKTIISTSVFTLAPAVSILLGVISLSKFLGLPLPWIRLSVIGAITYELPAATSTANALSVSLSETITDPKVYSAIAWVMTLGILPSIFFVTLLIKKIQKGLVSIQKKDSKWSEYFMTALFLGMISAFLGMVFADVSKGLIGFLPVFVLLFSAFIMCICGLLMKYFEAKGKKSAASLLTNFALPVSMLSAMAFAVFLEPLL